MDRELTFKIPSEDAAEFEAWCKRQELSLDDGLRQILATTRRDRNLDLIFEDDRFPAAFQAARGKIDPGTDIG